jgi:hypothetical protein
MRRILVLGVWSLLVVVADARAAEKAGVTLPDTLNAGGKALVLNGIGVREATVMNIDVYAAGLYLESKSSDPAQILGSSQVKRLDLVFVRDVDREDIVDAWKEGFKKNGADLAALGPRVGTLNAWMPEVKKRDVLSFLIEPGKGLTVTVKGKVRGTIPGDDFAKAFLAIWLGPKPPNGGLKKGLLGG